MRIFVITSRVPWPLEKGDKLRIYHQLSELNKRHEIILCCLNDQHIHPDTSKELSKICTEFHVFNLKKIGIAFQFIQALFSSKPFQVHYFYQTSIRKKIHKLIELKKPDVIYSQLIRTSEYVKHIHHIPKVIDYMDTFSKGMSRRIKDAKFPFKIILQNEAKRLKDYENLIFDYFEFHSIISKQDRSFIAHNKRNEIKVIPNGINKEFFRPTPKEKKYQLLFTGNMNYPPNVEGAMYIIQKILPLVWKTHPQTKIMIAGANPNIKLKALHSEKVNIIGWMDDIRDAYNSSDVFIAPMNIGTGLQNKLLEAMSMKMPCVTSKLANNALGAEENKDILIGNKAEEYASHIITLLENKEIAKEIAQQGQNYIHQNFSWENATKSLEDILKLK